PPAALRARLEAAGALKAPRVVTYCGGGIAATGVAFALALLGRDDVAVYDGSLGEWLADPARPMVTGQAPR
ncbi:MAG TPA: rhodanese-like domain-containing protein, partial [Methylomirabilota bacterium]|nr:rhodanese-like domain-containing protein [Methylomirabilota bacterium]